MKKILIGVLILSFIGMLAFIFFSDKQTQSPENFADLNPTVVDIEEEIAEEPVPDAAKKIDIITTDGGVLSVPDIRALPEAYDAGSGFYAFEGAWEIDRITNFGIMYSTFDDSFAIALTLPPLKEARRDAENYLMQKLGLSQSEMCRLNANVLVPASVSLAYAGKNLGFSFCPGSVDLK